MPRKALVVALTALAALQATAASGATVSGTIRSNGSPVSGVAVTVKWSGGNQSVTTGASGAYSVASVPTGGEVTIEVRPPVALRLAYRNWRTTSLASDLVKDFDLQSGYRLQGEYRKPDGTAYAGFRPGIDGIGGSRASGEFYGPAMNPDGSMDIVLAPGFYALTYNVEMAPYFVPPTIFDLRSGDVTGKVITLLRHSGPIPVAPPVATLITVGTPDAEGFAIVTGAPGAVPPLAAVVVDNLNAFTPSVTASDATGAFSATLYAPPGSSLLVKYDVSGAVLSELWNGASDPAGSLFDFFAGEMPSLPGTMLHVGTPPSGSETSQSFSAVSALVSVSPRGWAGLWTTGTLQTTTGGFSGSGALPGEAGTLRATLRITSPDVPCPSPPLSVSATLSLRNRFGADGLANPGIGDFASYLSTPTGLPIEHALGGETVQLVTAQFDDWTCAGSHMFEASAVIEFTVPADLPEGIYVPEIRWSGPGVSLSSSVAMVRSWYHSENLAYLPPLRVGEPATPRLPMVLLADHPLNGHRGVQAREDRGAFRMQTRVVFPPEQVVVPRLDERTGAPISYQLEPGSNWLSLTDRRLPRPLDIPLAFPSGTLAIEVTTPSGRVDTLGPAPVRQSSLRTPTTPGGDQIGKRTGTLGDVYHLRTMDGAFNHSFDQYGSHVIKVFGEVDDIYGNTYSIESTYDVIVARLLDLDPGGLPTMPYKQGDAFAPGLHVIPPVPADVTMKIVHMPNSNPASAVTRTVTGKANRFGYFQAPAGTEIRLEAPGEFRVDISAVYIDPEGTWWAGFMTWGNVVEGMNPMMEAHGRRGMDYASSTIDDMPAWFEGSNLPSEKLGLEVYFPYFSGDVHWGGGSIQPCISVRDLTGAGETIYSTLGANVAESVSEFRRPPGESPSLENLEKRIAVGEAPLFIATAGKKDPSMYPEAIKLLAYWYGTSERPNVRVREVISQDMLGVGYWGFDDTYGYQIGVPADGDHPGDMKWQFGGAVLRTMGANPINEYAIYSSLWTLVPDNDPVGLRITPPFQDATGASINGGPIMTLKGQDIDMLFLPKGVRPGDVLELGDTIAFSGHVGPPLDSRVNVTIRAPSGAQHSGQWHANKIGWLYNPGFDFGADEVGRWTVDVAVLHDRPYVGNGVIPQSHNTGTVLGTSGRYEFYVVEPGSPRLLLSEPKSGFITWPNWEIEPIYIQGVAPPGTTAVYYTIHDKGVVMGQGSVTPGAGGDFTITYDAATLHGDFSMLSLTAHEGKWEGLADEVAINLLAVGGSAVRANTVTLIGEQMFVESDPVAATSTPSPSATRTLTSAATQSPAGPGTSSPTGTRTSTRTPTRTPTVTPSVTPTTTGTTTPTRTGTATPTVTGSQPPTATSTHTPTRTATMSPSYTPTMSPTASSTRTPTRTGTAMLTHTPTRSATSTHTRTPTQTATTSPTATITLTPTGRGTATPTVTGSQPPTATSTHTPTRTATMSPPYTPTMSPTASSTRTPTRTRTATLAHTPTRSATQPHTGTPTQTATTSPTATITLTPTRRGTATPTVSPTAMPCAGDCDRDHAVRVNELITVVNIALGNAALEDCAAGDTDRDGLITIEELVDAVGRALGGCESARTK